MANYSLGDWDGLCPIGFITVRCLFYCPAGDAFSELTWNFPIIRELAEGSKEGVLVSKDEYNEEFIESFVAAGKRLADRGACGIITSCGFLAMGQPL